MRIIHLLLVLSVFMILTACGGGGGNQSLSGLEGKWAFTILIEGESTRTEASVT